MRENNPKNQEKWERVRRTGVAIASFLAGYLIWAMFTLVKLLLASKPLAWQDFTPWPGWLAGLVTLGISAVRYLSMLRQIPALSVKLDRVSLELETVRESGFEAVRSATKLIDNTLHTSFGNLNLSETHPHEYNQALEALGFNFRNWFEPINTNLGSPEIVSAWLTYIRTYYFEEAFDVKHREVVTNARNFTYLLLATLHSLSQHCGRQPSQVNGLKTVHLAVTPVHPKDWFNWPHGFNRPHRYFEEEFLGHFRRCIREVLHTQANANLLESRRYVLAACDDDARVESKTKFGWPLDLKDLMRDDLNNSWVLPVAVPVSLIASVNPALMHYYDYIVKANGTQRDVVSVVPLICRRWDLQQYDETANQSLAAIKADLDKKPTSFLPLIGLAQALYKQRLSEIQSDLSQRLSVMQSLGIQNAWTKCDSACRALLSDQPVPLYDAIVASHVLDVHLCEQDPSIAFAAQEALRKLMSAALHLKDCLVIDASSKRLRSLGEVFATELHSRPEHSQILSMSQSAIRTWSDDGLKSEFHIFGIQKGNEAPEWRIVIAADIDYPFEVAKVRILESGAPAREAEGRRIAGFEKYAAVATELYTKQMLFGKNVDVSPVWASGTTAVIA